jgi:hypothetical protein
MRTALTQSWQPGSSKCVAGLPVPDGTIWRYQSVDNEI